MRIKTGNNRQAVKRMDREKVIKGLEGVYLCISPVNHTCGDCPYQDNHVECIRRVLSDAIALLKEQEAEIRQLRLALDIAKGTCKGIVAEGRGTLE